jgi:hypothetical protein
MGLAKKESNSNNGGIGFWGLLTILFIALKLTNVIDWPWIWVLAPVWGGLALIVLILSVAWVVAVIVMAIKKAKKK